MKKPAGSKIPYTKILVAIAIIAVIPVAALIFYSWSNLPGNGPTNETGNNGSQLTHQWNCGDMQVDVNSVKEASSYVRFGIPKPASSGYKFEVISLTVTDKSSQPKDFSGSRLLLVAGNLTYSPSLFSSIERITLVDGTNIDYPCNESDIASKSQLTLNPGTSDTGCKIFQILRTSTPSALDLYKLNGEKCSIEL